jgi:ribosomal-protein-alanine N-acetyltransferase
MINFRLVLPHELPDVVALEISCGLSSRGVERFRRLIEDPKSILLGAFIEEEGENVSQIVGLFSGTIVVDEFQVDNLALIEQMREKGLGTQLVRLGLEKAIQLGAVTAILEVRSSNNVAQRLYENCGFRIVGKRIAYYRDPVEDALIMSYTLTT